jgi:hypothetical protein
MIFATSMEAEKESYIRILDMASHQITTLPGSDGKFAPQWSPDGQFISAASTEATKLYIFDMKSQRWSTLYDKSMFGFESWSSDSRFIYLFAVEHGQILRIPVVGGEAKTVAEVDFPVIGTNSFWFGLDPTDGPLMLRDVSTTDVYALTLEEK